MKKPKKPALQTQRKKAIAAEKRAKACDDLTSDAQRNGEYDLPKKRGAS